MTQEQLNAVWPGWTLTRKLGQGSYGGVYEICRTLPGGKVERAALKRISIPASQDEVTLLLAKSVSEQSISEHYQRQMQKLVGEYTMMRELDSCPNIVTSQDLSCQPNGYGWDIYLRMELLTPLKQVLSGQYQELDVLRLGLDICGALRECEALNIIHRDIKPENIMVSPTGAFKLGDFGIAKISEKTQTGTLAGTYGYMAPEVANRQHYGAAADIYSLGMVLYWLMNNKTGPFLPLPPRIPTQQQRQEALNRRFSGEALQEPQNGSRELKRIVLKACAFLPEDRYASAEQMGRELEALYGRKRENTEKILRELGLTSAMLEEHGPENADDRAGAAQSAPPVKKAHRRAFAGLACGLAAAAVLAVLGWRFLFARPAPAAPEAAMQQTFPTDVTVPTQEEAEETAPTAASEAATEPPTQAQTEPPLPEPDFTYELTDEGITITGIRGDIPSEITIPEFLDGSPVVAIGSNAFFSDQTLKKVTLPSGVREIGEKAFSGCVKLQSVTLPDQLLRIEASAFENCSSLSGVVLPDSLEHIGSWAFANCKVLSGIQIPATVTELGEWAFSGCTGLSDVQLSPGGLNIANYAFCGCRRLPGIVIPKGVENIGIGAFSNCEQLTQVELPESIRQIGQEAFQNTAVTHVFVSQYCSVGAGAFPLGCVIEKVS